MTRLLMSAALVLAAIAPAAGQLYGGDPISAVTPEDWKYAFCLAERPINPLCTAEHEQRIQQRTQELWDATSKLWLLPGYDALIRR
jgi:hypothetical protein